MGTSGIPSSNLSMDLQNWILPAVGAVSVASILVLLAGYGSRKQQKLPPGPRNWPVIGAFLSMDPILHKAFAKLAAIYGPVAHFRLGVQTMILVSSAEAAEELLKQKDLEFADRAVTMNRTLSKYTGMDSAVTAFANYNDSEFRLSRKISMTELLSGAKLKSYEYLRGKEMAVMVDNILSKIESSMDDKNDNRDVTAPSCPVAIREAASAMIQNIMFMMFIGKRFDDLPETDEIRKFPQLLKEQMAFVMKFNLIDFFPSLEWLDPQGILKDLKKFQKRQIKFFEMILERQRRERKLNGELDILIGDSEQSFPNFVNVLLRSQEEGDGGLSDKGLMGIVLSMWMAGIDTTASQVEWVLLELLRHPDLLQRLQFEVDGVVGKERPVQEADLQAMPFLKNIVLETIRLHPISTTSFPHVNMNPSTLGGYYIPPNSAVLLNIKSINCDPKTWTNPLDFNPDRFQVGSTPLSKPISANGTSYHFLTFGSGRRMCPGYNLAMALLLRIVATLVHAFELSPPLGCCGEDLSVEEAVSFIQHPKSDLVLACRPRLSHHVYKSSTS